MVRGVPTRETLLARLDDGANELSAQTLVKRDTGSDLQSRRRDSRLRDAGGDLRKRAKSHHI
jgi:hypothetical protein